MESENKNGSLPLLTVLFLAVLSIFLLASLEVFSSVDTSTHRAAGLAAQYMQIIKEGRLRRGFSIDSRHDPAGTGMIGIWMSQVTSVYGNLQAKQTSANPDFAGIVVDMLQQAGVSKGDVVAVGFSGSFPALNACVHAAATAMDIRLVCISSVAASQWGANIPGYIWLDMEMELFQRGVIKHRSVAASLGGRGDMAVGMNAEGVDQLMDAIRRNSTALINGKSSREQVDKRMTIFLKSAGASRIAAYINIGGGAASVGTPRDKRSINPGANLAPPETQLEADSIVERFFEYGAPVIHLSDMSALSRKYRLPWAPQTANELSRLNGGVYSKSMAAVMLFVQILALLIVWLRFGKRKLLL